MDETADIQELADQVMREGVIAQALPVLRASVGYEVAVAYGKKIGLTDETAKELATVVKKRIEGTVVVTRDKSTIRLFEDEAKEPATAVKKPIEGTVIATRDKSVIRLFEDEAKEPATAVKKPTEGTVIGTRDKSTIRLFEDEAVDESDG